MNHSHNPTGADEQTDCRTTNSFEDHGINNGKVLIEETYRWLVNAGVTSFAPDNEFFTHLETAFRQTYLAMTDDEEIHTHVELAIEDSLARTLEEFRHEPTADLRTRVLPSFYQKVSGFHCIYSTK